MNTYSFFRLLLLWKCARDWKKEVVCYVYDHKHENVYLNYIKKQRNKAHICGGNNDDNNDDYGDT